MTASDKQTRLRAAMAAVRDSAETVEAQAASLLQSLPVVSIDDGLRTAMTERCRGLNDVSGRVMFELALLQSEISEGKADSAAAVERLTQMDATMMGAVAPLAEVLERLEKAAERDEVNEPAFVLVIEATGAMLQAIEQAKAATQAMEPPSQRASGSRSLPPPAVRVAVDGSVVIVQVGAEGGDLTLIGREGDEAGWQFARVTNDQSEALFGEVDVPIEAPDLTSLVWVDGWADGLRLLDRYPWARLYPVYVHPEFVERVRAAVDGRLAGVDPGDAEWAREKWERIFLQAKAGTT